MIKVKIIKFRKILLLVCFSIGFKVLFVLLMISKNWTTNWWLNNSVFRLGWEKGIKYLGLSSTFLNSLVFLYKLTSSLQPPSRYSKTNFGILLLALALKSSIERYFGLYEIVFAKT